MEQELGVLTVSTRGFGFIDVTNELNQWVQEAGLEAGLLTMLLQHTSASLVIQENADPDVLRDLADALQRLAPESHPYRHSAEGPDDMPAHIKAALTSPSLSVPVMGGRMALGTWQAVYVAEHRAMPHRRRVALHFSGTRSLA
ncbi:MAG: YjbQ family protein [Parvularculaceae bacterium]|nr:YjbQ family protein [Parvularculaceae bacterium]